MGVDVIHIAAVFKHGHGHQKRLHSLIAGGGLNLHDQIQPVGQFRKGHTARLIILGANRQDVMAVGKISQALGQLSRGQVCHIAAKAGKLRQVLEAIVAIGLLGFGDLVQHQPPAGDSLVIVLKIYGNAAFFTFVRYIMGVGRQAGQANKHGQQQQDQCFAQMFHSRLLLYLCLRGTSSRISRISSRGAATMGAMYSGSICMASAITRTSGTAASFSTRWPRTNRRWVLMP